ncbi:MAG: HlyD family secretion protein, partial [Anaerolineae bacterium]
AKAAAVQEDLAAAAVDEAVAAQEGAAAAVRALTAMRDDPVELAAAADAAEVEYRQAQAAVDAARANLELLTAGPTDEEVAAARAALMEAEAALDALQAQRAGMVLRAPTDGVGLRRSVEVGEIAPAGVPLLRLADMDRVKLEVFVPEGSLGEVEIGQGVTVRVDAYGDEEFAGELTAIADEAQFTPRNVQTAAERANLVFAVTITLENPEHRLRPGMPAEVTLASSGQ